MKNNKAMDLLAEKAGRIGKENIKEMDYVSFIDGEILHEGDELIYLTRTGSHLYGMDTEDSDLDLKGIFIPSVKSLVLDDKADQYGPYTTSDKDNERNTSEDIDIELWSIHKLFSLLQRGDTNAYDILFSLSNQETGAIYSEERFRRVYNNRKRLIGSKPIRKSFIGYAYGQYKRYEAKGFNFQTLKFILKWFKDKDYNTNDKLVDYINDLIEDLKITLSDKFEDGDELWKQVVNQIRLKSGVNKEQKDETFVEINNYKKYPVGIRVKKFLDHIQNWTKEYGSRVKGNEDGIDWKSLSHAFRVLYIAESLAERGNIEFPINDFAVRMLLDVKEGKGDYRELVQSLEVEVDKVGDLLRESDKLRVKSNAKLMRELLLDFYGEEIYRLGRRLERVDLKDM